MTTQPSETSSTAEAIPAPADAAPADRAAGDRPYGLVAEYSTVDAVIAAARRVREARYTRWDVLSPFPIHGIDGAMGVRPTRLPWIVFGAGLTGLVLAFLLQWWTNAVAYPFQVSGKPLFAWPPATPVGFEVTILLAGITTFLCVLALNGLPHWSHPILASERIRRATSDRFLVVIEHGDPQFDPKRTRALLDETRPDAIEEAAEPDTPSAIPRAIIWGLLVAGLFALLPPVLAARERHSIMERPRIQPIQDMAFQPKARAQSASPAFEDGRAMREPVAGTVAQGELREDDHLYRGRVGGDEWARSFPVEITDELMERGRQRYEIFCGACHGLDGSGEGMIHERAVALEQAGWVPPTDLRSEPVRELTEGELFDVITNGVRTMPAFRSQASAEDRWAIVLYLRALQRSGHAPADALPDELRAKLED